MYCKNCGKETNNENCLCDECAQQVKPEEYKPVVEEASNHEEVKMDVIPGKGKGIAALVFGILSITCASIIFAIVGMVLGKKSIGTEGQKLGIIGKKLAIAGLIVSIVVMVFSFIYGLVVGFAMFGEIMGSIQ